MGAHHWPSPSGTANNLNKRERRLHSKMVRAEWEPGPGTVVDDDGSVSATVSFCIVLSVERVWSGHCICKLEEGGMGRVCVRVREGALVRNIHNSTE